MAGKKHVPGDLVYLWDLARIQEGVGYAGEGCSDVERDDEGLFEAVVRFSCCPRLLHGGVDGGVRERYREDRIGGASILNDSLQRGRSRSTAGSAKGISKITSL